MKKKSGVAAALAIVMVAGSVALAGPVDDFAGERPRHKREKVRQRVELMMMWRLTEALDLDSETAAVLFPLLHEFDVKQRERYEARHQLVRQMKEELKETSADSAALRKMLEDFKKNESDIVALRNERLDKLGEILSDEQVARLVVHVPQFEKDIREMAFNARKGPRRERERLRDPSLQTD